MSIRPAQAGDLAEILCLIGDYAASSLLLPRTPEDVRANLPHFLVLTGVATVTATGDLPGTDDRRRLDVRPCPGTVIGCVALEQYGDHLAEIRSLAVHAMAQGQGLGGQLLEAALEIARKLRIPRVFAVTHATHFFEQHGFIANSRHAVPEKIARDCMSCPHSKHCELTAMIASISTVPAMHSFPAAVWTDNLVL